MRSPETQSLLDGRRTGLSVKKLSRKNAVTGVARAYASIPNVAAAKIPAPNEINTGLFPDESNYQRAVAVLGSSKSEHREILIAPGKFVKTTPVFDTYWRFAAKRQALFMKRVKGLPPPWTDDVVLASHRFTNAYRASDRVSQYLIRHVLYEGKQTGEEIFFRCLLFKIFNRTETWAELVSNLGFPTWKNFDVEKYSAVLDKAMARGQTIYSAAYIMPSPAFGYKRKHRNHLRLLEHMMQDGAPKKIERANSLQEVFALLRGYRSFGDFLAFQYAIDLNYSAMIDFSEMDFVVAGPGAREGIQKCFINESNLDEASIIRAVTERASEEFSRLNLSFEDLWGRPLQLIDCQNLFCEVGKYARVVHPEFSGLAGRTRIKQKFVQNRTALAQFYPPKWGLRLPSAQKGAALVSVK